MPEVGLKFTILWVILLKGGRKRHLSPSDEWGEPARTTVCGKVYDPAARIEAKKGLDSLPELWMAKALCTGCFGRFARNLSSLSELLTAHGKSKEEAMALAEKMLGLKRELSK